MSKNTCRVRLISGIDVRRRLMLSRHLKRVILSACGVEEPCTPPSRIVKLNSELTLDAKIISNCVKQLGTKATVFRKTGGVHAAAIFLENGELVAFAEDVGRHNAVDKTIGMAIIDKIDLSSCFLALTGRLTADIVLKAVHVGLPIVTSIAAALDSGIAIAKQADLTLIGFVRGRRMNVYTHPERIVV